MNLNDFVKTIEADTVVHIGSGSSFFFIGTAEEYEKDIDSITEEWRAEFKKQFTEAEKSVSLNENNRTKAVGRINCENEKLQGRLAKSLWDRETASVARELAEDIEALKTLERKASELKASLENAESKLLQFKEFRQRELVEEPYERLQGDGVVVSVTGSERGNFWFKYEYDARRKKNESK